MKDTPSHTDWPDWAEIEMEEELHFLSGIKFHLNF